MDLEDIPAMVVAILGVLIILVPVLGLTLRMVAKPLAEAFAQVQAAQGRGSHVRALEQRMEAIEQHVREVDRAVARLGEDEQFLRQLEAPGEDRRPEAPPSIRVHRPQSGKGRSETQ